MLTLLLALAIAAPPPSAPPDSLEARVRERIHVDSAAKVGVAYWRLGSGADSLFVHDNWTFHAASTMKVPVMVQLFRMVDAGQLSLDQRITLKNQFVSLVDSSSYALDMADDSDSSLYARVGQAVTVRELMGLMITRSSNLATNVLIELAGPVKVTATMRSLGAEHIRVLRGVEDGKAYRAGLNNTVTARDLAIVMAAIAQDRAASPASCAAMRAILFGQEFKDEIPAGLPAGVPVAHKTGWVDGVVLHDAAIIYPPGGRPYVLVVLTSGIADLAQDQRLIAGISRIIWRHATSAAPAP
jgi:beta-lactamase class A